MTQKAPLLRRIVYAGQQGGNIADLAPEVRLEIVTILEVQGAADQLCGGLIAAIEGGTEMGSFVEFLRGDAEENMRRGHVYHAALDRALVTLLEGGEPVDVPPFLQAHIEAVQTALRRGGESKSRTT
ncbi:MAG: hypothetical protein HC897_04025 [Thermoanaerobaculia bacterium]|nr:hypothetical protein [Thermoanaerobaculia bacterium]